jgi:hypothetical protein
VLPFCKITIFLRLFFIFLEAFSSTPFQVLAKTSIFLTQKGASFGRSFWPRTMARFWLWAFHFGLG